ncbi:MAG: hypothetical protein EU539_07490 [Promethearchaeota archaeon]|nr:MAG: hypothetical protein EU539_07490 [Candidatus Lokiarchaeota archaeon]
MTKSDEILKYLQIGINIPIWPEFHKYILHDLNYFNAQSIILENNGFPAGHALIYSNGINTLYFGYFRVLNHDQNLISFLIDELISYARENNFKRIMGPINIPTVIYGWGFMKEGSSESLYVGKPVNPPIYQKLFMENKFKLKLEETSWEGPSIRINPYKLKIYDYNDYEYFNPKDLNDLRELKKDFLRINNEHMPESARITPKISELFDNYADFVFTYGYKSMIFFVRYKPTGEIVGCGSNLPNPFSTDEKGNNDSIVAYTWAVSPKHRGKGLPLLMYGATSLDLWKKGIRYTSVPTGGKATHSFEKYAKILNLQKKRFHLVLELKLEKD